MLQLIKIEKRGKSRLLLYICMYIVVIIDLRNQLLIYCGDV